MWLYPKIVAHRGGGSLAPENTLAALRCGLAHGFRAVEFDVMLTKDCIPVLMHDFQLGRTVRGIGSIADINAQALTAMDAGSWFSPAFAGEPVPTLAQAISFCKANGVWMNIEIKPVPGWEQVTGEKVAYLVNELHRDVLSGKGQHVARTALPLLSSFSYDALLAAKKVAPNLARAYLMDKMVFNWQHKLQALEAVALHVNHTHLTPVQVGEVKRENLALFCYTVNTPERAAELLTWGVDAFCTDRIDLIGADFPR